jgi:hypothetical protein
MVATTAGLPGNGITAHYEISYESSLSKADGLDRANALLATCEADFALMKSWFGGIELEFDYPIPVLIDNASGGASWDDPSELQVAFGWSPAVTIRPGSGTSVDVIRYLLVSEITEMFMATLKNGWFEPTSLFHGADEGSKGEGLSRFLGIQFQLANAGPVGRAAPSGFAVTNLWLNSPRPDYVNDNPDDIHPDIITGCTTLFLFYLRDELGITVDSLIAAGGSTLADVYRNLRLPFDGWTTFRNLVNDHYPQGFSYNPLGESVFPVSGLSAFFSPGSITSGYSNSTHVFIDKPAMAEVNISLTSDDPTIVKIPPVVTIGAGQLMTGVPISTSPIPLPFLVKTVNVHATYAGKTLTVPVQINPVRVVSATFVPSTVICGDPTSLVITLDRPSLLGDVDITIINGYPGYIDKINGSADIDVAVSITQNHLSVSIPVTTHNFSLTIRTSHASVIARYLDDSWGGSQSWAEATLTIETRVIGGILQTLTVFPAAVTGGRVTHGTVTLEEPVPQDTVVALAALEPGTGLLPIPQNFSHWASVPDSVTVLKGRTTAIFEITTTAPARGTTQTATILAAAVAMKTATLKISSWTSSHRPDP